MDLSKDLEKSANNLYLLASPTLHLSFTKHSERHNEMLLSGERRRRGRRRRLPTHLPCFRWQRDRRCATVARRYSTQTALWTRSGLFIPTLPQPQITNVLRSDSEHHTLLFALHKQPAVKGNNTGNAFLLWLGISDYYISLISTVFEGNSLEMKLLFAHLPCLSWCENAVTFKIN